MKIDLALCKNSAQHHQELASYHKASASCYRGLIGKAGSADYFADLAACHEQAAASHEKMCKTFIEIEEGLEDEAGDSTIETNMGAGEDLLNAALGEERFIKLVPTSARGSFTTTAGPTTPSITLIPRYGSPQPQTSTRPTVNDTDFLDLAALESD